MAHISSAHISSVGFHIGGKKLRRMKTGGAIYNGLSKVKVGKYLGGRVAATFKQWPFRAFRRRQYILSTRSKYPIHI
jgi:hypothetical protein